MELPFTSLYFNGISLCKPLPQWNFPLQAPASMKLSFTSLCLDEIAFTSLCLDGIAFTSLFTNRLVDIITNPLPVRHFVNTFSHIVADSCLFPVFVNASSNPWNFISCELALCGVAQLHNCVVAEPLLKLSTCEQD